MEAGTADPAWHPEQYVGEGGQVNGLGATYEYEVEAEIISDGEQMAYEEFEVEASSRAEAIKKARTKMEQHQAYDERVHPRIRIRLGERSELD